MCDDMDQPVEGLDGSPAGTVREAANNKRKGRENSSPELLRASNKHLRTEAMDQHGPPAPPVTSSHRNSKLTCFRITGIPLDWEKATLISNINLIDPTFQEIDCRLSLFPACSGSTQTALLQLDLETCGEYFRCIRPNVDKFWKVRKAGDVGNSVGVVLVFDRHFLDLTPLNTPVDEIAADVIAVTGLAGHAYGSWRSRQTGCMWLEDFLPHDVGNIRIMTYGYDSSLTRDTTSHQFIDYKRHFIQSLMDARSSCETRPVIFIGHSMGGILILQVLLQSKNGGQYKSLFESTHAIFFFATPHQGIQVKELREMVHDLSSGSSQGGDFIEQLEEGSNFLSMQREDVTNLWELGSDIGIASFYETEMTATVSRSLSGDWTRAGKEVEMVKRDSAVLFWPFEHRIPVQSNHTDIVKFSSNVDSTYRATVTHMTSWVQNIKIAEHKKMLLNSSQEEFQKILNWLYPHSTTKRHIDIQENRNEGIGKWALYRVEFDGWIRGDACSNLLWVRGIPGSGKTYFSSVVIDHLLDKNSLSQDCGVAYFYFDYNDQDRQTPTDVLSSLIKQLSTQLSHIPIHLKSLYDKLQKDKRRPTYSELYSTLLEIPRSFSRTFVVFDALDECDRQKQREKLLPLAHLLGKSGFDVFMTSRPFPNDIQHSFSGIPSIEFSADKQDIISYIYNRIDMNPGAKLLIRGSGKGEQIVSDLVNIADGMFLFISLNIDHLFQQPTRRNLLDELEKLKKCHQTENPLDPTYDRIMETLHTQIRTRAKLAMKIISWIVTARRTLTIEELQYAVSVKLGASSLDRDLIPEPITMVDVCAGLVVFDEKSKTIRLTHFTTQEYILRKQVLPKDVDSIVARVCLTYLSFEIFGLQGAPRGSLWGTFEDNFRSRLYSYPLFEYSAKNISYHLNPRNERATITDVLSFTKKPNNTAAYLDVVDRKYSPYDHRYRTRPLGVASKLGHTMAVQELLRELDLIHGNDWGSQKQAAIPLSNMFDGVMGHDRVMGQRALALTSPHRWGNCGAATTTYPKDYSNGKI